VVWLQFVWQIATQRTAISLFFALLSVLGLPAAHAMYSKLNIENETSTWERVATLFSLRFCHPTLRNFGPQIEVIVMLDVVVALATLGIWAYGVWSIPKCIACIDGARARRNHGNQRDDSRVVVIEETTATFATIYPMAEQAVRISSKEDLLGDTVVADSDSIPEAKLVEPVKVYTHRSFWL